MSFGKEVVHKRLLSFGSRTELDHHSMEERIESQRWMDHSLALSNMNLREIVRSLRNWKIEGGGLGPVDQWSLEFLFAARVCHIVYIAHDEAYLWGEWPFLFALCWWYFPSFRAGDVYSMSHTRNMHHQLSFLSWWNFYSTWLTMISISGHSKNEPFANTHHPLNSHPLHRDVVTTTFRSDRRSNVGYLRYRRLWSSSL